MFSLQITVRIRIRRRVVIRRSIVPFYCPLFRKVIVKSVRVDSNKKLAKDYGLSKLFCFTTANGALLQKSEQEAKY